MGSISNLFEAPVLERRASVENPATRLSNPAAWLTEALGGGPSVAGVNVNERTALSVAGLWRGVSLVSGLVGALSLFVNERLEPRGRRHAPEHPVYWMLHERANPEMSSQTVRETLQQHAMLWGNGYAEIEFNNSGRPIGWWPLLPDRTWPERRNGVKRYITMINGHPQVLRPDQVLHVPGMGFDGLVGYSMVGIHRENIARPLALRQFGNEFYGNAAAPGGFLEHPKTLSREAQERLLADWEGKNVGLGKRHRTSVLEEGMTWKPMTMPLKDAEYVETEKITVIDMSRLLGVPPHKLYELGRATWNNIEAENINFHTDTMLIWLTRWEHEMNYKLFPPAELGRFYTRFNVDTILRADAKSRAESNQIQFQNGALTEDEWRELEDRNPLPGEMGNTPLVMANMVPLERLINAPIDKAPTGQPADGAAPAQEVGAGTEDVQTLALNGAQIAALLEAIQQVTTKMLSPNSAKALIKAAFPSLTDGQINAMVDGAVSFTPAPDNTPPPPDAGPPPPDASQRGIAEAFQVWLGSEAQRCVQREVQAARKAARSGKFVQWFDGFYDQHRTYIRRLMQPVALALAATMGCRDERLMEQLVGDMAQREISVSVGQLSALMRDNPADDLEGAVLRRLNTWADTRADLWAEREIKAMAEAIKGRK